MTGLYQLLEDSNYHSIICWDDKGKRVLIKDSDTLVKKILPRFERCVTLINFFRRLEDCRFFETFEKDLGANYVFENLFFTRDKKPCFDIELKKKKSMQQQPGENPSLKKVHKASEEEIAEDLRTLVRFEEMLQYQMDQRAQLIKSKISELDSDLQLSSQVKKLINTLQAERLLNSL